MNTTMGHNELRLMREILDYRPRNGRTILVSHTHLDRWKEFVDTITGYRDSLLRTLVKGATVNNL